MSLVQIYFCTNQHISSNQLGESRNKNRMNIIHWMNELIYKIVCTAAHGIAGPAKIPLNLTKVCWHYKWFTTLYYCNTMYNCTLRVHCSTYPDIPYHRIVIQKFRLKLIEIIIDTYFYSPWQLLNTS